MNAKQLTGKQKSFLCAAFLLVLMGLSGLLVGVWNDVPKDLVSAVSSYQGTIGYIIEIE